MLGAVILQPERQGIAQLCTGIGNSAAADVSVMGRFSVVASEECIRSGRISASAIFIGPGKVVDIRHADTVFHIPYTAEMNQNRIPFRGNRNIVSTAASDISDSDTSDSCTLSVVSAASSVTGSFCAPNTVPHGITDVAATVAVNVIAIILVSFLFFIIILLLFFLGANPPCNLIFIKKYNDARNNSPFFKMVSFFYFLFRKKHPKIQI